jgi:hypothetical protein
VALRAQQHGAGTTTPMTALPPELLQHICSLLKDPDDLASCHLVDTRYTHASGVRLPTRRCRPWCCKVDMCMLVANGISNFWWCGAGFVTQPDPHSLVLSRITQASSTWRCNTATHCAN